MRPFPAGTGGWQASVNGGQAPHWRGDGRELYYVEGSTLMAVSASSESTFTLGQPQPLFEARALVASVGITPGGYDVSAAGQRFLIVSPVEEAENETAPPTIRVVQNWYEEFRERER